MSLFAIDFGVSLVVASLQKSLDNKIRANCCCCCCCCCCTKTLLYWTSWSQCNTMQLSAESCRYSSISFVQTGETFAAVVTVASTVRRSAHRLVHQRSICSDAGRQSTDLPGTSPRHHWSGAGDTWPAWGPAAALSLAHSTASPQWWVVVISVMERLLVWCWTCWRVCFCWSYSQFTGLSNVDSEVVGKGMINNINNSDDLLADKLPPNNVSTRQQVVVDQVVFEESAVRWVESTVKIQRSKSYSKKQQHSLQ